VLAVASWLMLKAIYFEVKSASAGTRQGGVLVENRNPGDNARG